MRLGRLIVVAIAACALRGTVAAAPTPAIQLPGAAPFDAAFQSQLREAWKKSPVYKSDSSPKFINRLIFASSPYLQQHSLNPVNWYPWGDEAFAAAKRDNKPVFLSIGYATCHWCHVMEEESFKNPQIARLLNEGFISIKVDREERPDIDALYIAAVEKLTGGGGWPLNVFLDPERQPFYGGTYFPPSDRGGRPGLPKVLQQISETWKSGPDTARSAAVSLLKTLAPQPASPTELSEATLAKAAADFGRAFDATNGGFGRSTKFPQPHTLVFLLRYGARAKDAQATQMAETTLNHMAAGAIHDILGGGFHRYSVTPDWTQPHYEKMLYDQAGIARAYLEASQALRPQYGEVSRFIFEYVLRDLHSPEGAFFTAEDADSEGEEGRFYLWTRAQVIKALGQNNGALVADFYSLTETPRPLVMTGSQATFVETHKIGSKEFEKVINEARQALLAVRNQRPRPRRDDKIITAWNGLMIADLARAGAMESAPDLGAAAAKAADFLLRQSQRNGRLMRSWRNGVLGVPGFLDDYAFLISGLLELYESTFDPRWLREATRLSNDMLRLFADPSNGSLRYRASDHEALVATTESLDDAALPAAQSVAADVLLRLGRMTTNAEYEKVGHALLAANSADVARSPTAYAALLQALMFALGPSKEIVIIGPRDSKDTQILIAIAHVAYLPNAVLLQSSPGDTEITKLAPFVAKQPMLDGKATAYVCENYVCKRPTNDPKQFAISLGVLNAAAPPPTPAAAR